MERPIISGLAQPLISSLLNNVIEEAACVVHFRTDFLVLCEELEFIRLLLDNLLNWQNSPNSVKNWLERLQDILEDAEKILEDCNREISFHKIILRYRLGRRIKAATKRIKSIRKEASVVSSVYQTKIREHPIIQSEFYWPTARANYFQPTVEPFAVGMQTNFRILHQVLFENEAANVVGVLGMGGIGKTLLLQSIYNSREVHSSFTGESFMIWLTVSQNPVIPKLQAMLCRQIHLDVGDISSEGEARWIIYTFLRGKKLLVILDDVWAGGERVLERVAGFQEGNDCIKVVVSTRDDKVLKKMGANHVLKMEALSEEQSWELFRFHAFRPCGGRLPQEEEDIEQIAKDVARECKGLPLAIKTIAVAMVGEWDRRQWQLALNQLRNTDRTFYVTRPDTEKELFHRLRLSYNMLSFCLRPCFLYCAAFPEDEEIDAEYLIQLWISEGLIRSDRFSDVEEIGRHYLNILIENCLLDVCKKDWEGRVICCKMHDVLRDMAIHIAEEEERCLFRAGRNSNTLPVQLFQRRRRISLIRNNISFLPERFNYPKLGTLLLRENRYLKHIPEGFLRNLQAVKILDLSWTDLQSLPESIGCLQNLVSLRLSRTKIWKLPRSLKDLKRLQILDLSGCWKLKKLPSGIGNLKTLECLDLSWCWKLEFLPRALSDLTSLSSLKIYNCSNLAWRQELGSTQDETNSSARQMGTMEEQKMSLTDIGCFRQLRQLDIDCRNSATIPDDLMENFVEMRSLRLDMRKLLALPEDMKHMANLEILRLKTWNLQQLPGWVFRFYNLRWLELSNCQNLKTLPMLERMPQLRRLQIAYCTHLRELPADFGRSAAFPSLEDLKLERLDMLEELPTLEMGSMSRLQEFRVIRCINIRRLPEGIERLRSLRLLDLSHSYELIRSFKSSATNNEEERNSFVQAVQILTHTDIQLS
eukprot:Gb_22529 [translate_table: standard]